MYNNLLSDNMKWNAFGYLRLSDDDENRDVSNSIINQQKIISNFVGRNNDIEIVDYFCDDGFTGANFDRPSFKNMMGKIKNGDDGVNCIIVKHLSRFGRDTSEVLSYIQKQFPTLGIRFIAIEQDIDNYKTDIANQSIKLPIYSFADEVHVIDTSRKVRESLNVKRSHGLYMGSHLPYGYLRNESNKYQLIIDYDVKDNVVSIFEMYLSGHSIKSISEKMNLKGIDSPLAHFVNICVRKLPKSVNVDTFGKWTPGHVKTILQNDLLTGDMVQGKTTSYSYKIKKRLDVPKDKWQIVKNTHEPIISHEAFTKVQELLKINSKPQKTKVKPSILNGIVYCGVCGCRMYRSSKKVKDAEYSYFACSSFSKNKSLSKDDCSKIKIIEKDILDKIKSVIEQDNIRFKSISDLIDIKQDINNVLSEKELLANEILEYQNMIAQAKDDYGNRILGIEDYLEIKSSLEKDLVRATEKYHSLLPDQDHSSPKDKSIADTSSNNIYTKKLTRSMILSFIDRIEINHNKEISIIRK